MQSLLVVDAQNEFSARGQRPVDGHAHILSQIMRRVDAARAEGWPIGWVRHHNKPHESKAFVPGSWGAELSPGLVPATDSNRERLFEKDVFGAFGARGLEGWLRGHKVTDIQIVGFYAHMCLSTAAREALVRGFDVQIDPDATGARDLHDPALGAFTADEVKRSALLHLLNMGATLAPPLSITATRLAG